jgi:hypothetical protein
MHNHVDADGIADGQDVRRAVDRSDLADATAWRDVNVGDPRIEYNRRPRRPLR